jgi:NAD dependent epimerase/dehydratase family enzyme
MKNRKIILAGGTGFMGQAIAKYFGEENDIVILGRSTDDAANNKYSNKLLSAHDGLRIRYVQWDAKTVEKHWLQELNGADMVINLAGKSVNCRYHEKNKKAIIASRQLSTAAIGEAIRQAAVPPKLWINAASATIYKNTFSGPQDEFNGGISELKNDNMPYSFIDRLRCRKNKLICALRHGSNSSQCKEFDHDFSVKVCKLWEAALFEQRTPFTRKIALRAAITLGEGGVMIPYLNLCKAAMGGRHGNGKQMYSWVHVDDVCRMIDWFWKDKELEGIFNCAAPNPVTNEQFMSTLRKITGHHIGLPAPAWMLELGAWLIGTETELMLKSRWVVPTRALNQGFRFKYDTLEKALSAIIEIMPRKKYHLF